METLIQEEVLCQHCGESCGKRPVRAGGSSFCCEGCKLVYELLDRNGLHPYYTLNKRPGIHRRSVIREDGFAFLDEEKIRHRLISFSNDSETHVFFYLPQIHCSSCLFLLRGLNLGIPFISPVLPGAKGAAISCH